MSKARTSRCTFAVIAALAISSAARADENPLSVFDLSNLPPAAVGSEGVVDVDVMKASGFCRFPDVSVRAALERRKSKDPAVQINFDGGAVSGGDDKLTIADTVVAHEYVVSDDGPMICAKRFLYR